MAPDAEPAVFSLNGTTYTAPDPTVTLATFLRSGAARPPVTSVKVGCAEGGCGACAVLVRRPGSAAAPPSTATLNACLTPVGVLHGASLLASDGLGRTASGGPHAVHDALASAHASQCGFCTPGFAVACAAAAMKATAACGSAAANGGGGGGACAAPGAGADVIARALDGNLCRCTGYRPILDAARGLTAADVEDVGGRLAPPAAVRAAAAATGTVSLSCGGAATTASRWLAPSSLADARAALAAAVASGGPVRVVAGNTGAGVYKASWPPAPGTTVVALSRAADMGGLAPTADGGGLVVGAAASLADLADAAGARARGAAAPPRWAALAAHLARVAGAHVRAAATLGGNIALAADPATALESDPVTLLAAAGATVAVDGGGGGGGDAVPILDLVHGGRLAPGALITAITIPAPAPGEHFFSTRVATRYSHAVASFNCALSLSPSTPPIVVFGYHRAGDGAWRATRVPAVEAALAGGDRAGTAPLAAALAAARDAAVADARDAEFVAGVAEGALAAALAPVFAGAAEGAPAKAKAVLDAALLPPPVPVVGTQAWGKPRAETAPVGEPIQKDRARLQASGEAIYTSDVPLPPGGLHAAPVLSARAAGAFSVDAAPALALPGVVAYVDAASIPPGGSNDIIGDTIFAVGEVCYVGERIGLVLADTDAAARAGAAAVAVTYAAPTTPPILSIADATAAGSFFDLADVGGTKRAHGGVDAAAALAAAPHRLRGVRLSTPSQAHMYMETQAAVAFPDEGGSMKVISGTQCVDMVQLAVAAALALPAHAVSVTTRRLGGGFGGKSARSQPVAAAAAVAAAATGRPVRLVLTRGEDLAMIGGRCELECEYDVGFDETGRVLALIVRSVFLGGARPEISKFIPVLFAGTLDQNYAFASMDIDLKLARTNLPPRTIMRAPGTLQATVVAEHVVESVAAALGASPLAVREANLLTHESLPDFRRPCAGVPAETAATPLADAAPDGTTTTVVKTALDGEIPLDQYTVPKMWGQLKVKADVEGRLKEVERFNAASSPWIKRGLSMTSARFVMNVDAKPAAVHIHHDGSVLITCPGHEMGQGLHTKVVQSACAALSGALPAGAPHLPLSLFRVADTCTDALPNCGPSWGSTTSESSCEAVRQAAAQLAAALAPKFAAGDDGRVPTWQDVIKAVHPSVGFSASTIPLTAFAFYDGTQRAGGAGKPLVYNGCGVAATEVTLNALTGEVRVDRCDVMLDAAASLNPALDVGQVEGGLVQGLGFVLSEAVAWDGEGKLTTGSTWDYKIPTVDGVPRALNVHLLEDAPHARGVLSSKAVGEPPLLLAVTALHAAQAAIDAVRAGLGDDAEPLPVNGRGEGGVAPPRVSLAPPATPAAVKAAVGRLPLAAWALGGEGGK